MGSRCGLLQTGGPHLMPKGQYVRCQSRSEFFWSRVQKGSPDECWMWLGDSASGYGYAKGRKLAHRESYELNCGGIPAGSLVLHSCDNSLCVNPKHLSLGDQSQNMKDRRDRFPFSGAACGSGAKLTRRDVQLIRAIQASCRPITPNIIRTACYQQVSLSAIRDVLSGRNWKHVILEART